ncbi:hypothetical protein Tco_0139958 [Tanacetum coccineum]
MPYPRFTKVIIYYFLSQHDSISKRQGSYINTIKDDGVLGSLKFISKGEPTQVYGMPIPDTMVNGGNGKRVTVTTTKKGSLSAEENILSNPDEALEEQASGVDKETVKHPKKRKMKGIATDAAAQELLNLKKGTRKSIEDYILQQIPKGSSEGSGTKPKVPDEPNGKSKGSSKEAGITPEVTDEPKGKSVAHDKSDDD